MAFRALRMLVMPGVAPRDLLASLEVLSRVKLRYKQVIEGLDIVVHFDNALADRIVSATANVLARFVPDEEKLQEALQTFDELIGSHGPADRVHEGEGSGPAPCGGS